jgi:hypothetical protein
LIRCRESGTSVPPGPKYLHLTRCSSRRHLLFLLEAEAQANGRTYPTAITQTNRPWLARRECRDSQGLNLQATACRLMQTLNHQLVAEGVADGGLAAIGQGDWRTVGGVQGEQFDALWQALDGWVHAVGFIG